MTILLTKRIENKESLLKPLLCLLDSGATSCWITCNAIPKGTQGETIAGIMNQTLAVTFSSNQELTLSNFLFPEFHRARHIDNIQAKYLTNHADMI